MQIKLDIPNKQVAEHVLWLLQHFEKDGVVIEQKNNINTINRLIR